MKLRLLLLELLKINNLLFFYFYILYILLILMILGLNLFLFGFFFCIFNTFFFILIKIYKLIEFIKFIKTKNLFYLCGFSLFLDHVDQALFELKEFNRGDSEAPEVINTYNFEVNKPDDCLVDFEFLSNIFDPINNELKFYSSLDIQMSFFDNNSDLVKKGYTLIEYKKFLLSCKENLIIFKNGNYNYSSNFESKVFERYDKFIEYIDSEIIKITPAIEKFEEVSSIFETSSKLISTASDITYNKKVFEKIDSDFFENFDKLSMVEQKYNILQKFCLDKFFSGIDIYIMIDPSARNHRIYKFFEAIYETQNDLLSKDEMLKLGQGFHKGNVYQQPDNMIRIRSGYNTRILFNTDTTTTTTTTTTTDTSIITDTVTNTITDTIGTTTTTTTTDTIADTIADTIVTDTNTDIITDTTTTTTTDTSIITDTITDTIATNTDTNTITTITDIITAINENVVVNNIDGKSLKILNKLEMSRMSKILEKPLIFEEEVKEKVEISENFYTKWTKDLLNSFSSKGGFNSFLYETYFKSFFDLFNDISNILTNLFYGIFMAKKEEIYKSEEIIIYYKKGLTMEISRNFINGSSNTLELTVPILEDIVPVTLAEDSILNIHRIEFVLDGFLTTIS